MSRISRSNRAQYPGSRARNARTVELLDISVDYDLSSVSMNAQPSRGAAARARAWRPSRCGRLEPMVPSRVSVVAFTVHPI
eukprot:SAG11_NODE_13480_length_653_cov_1.642599_1_plen_81_part_00